MEVLILSSTIISGIISFFAISLSLWAIIEVKALKNSTHKIEWKAIEDPFKNSAEDVEEFNEDPLEGV